jgi:coniferyl-aldehyde dehydrogenase
MNLTDRPDVMIPPEFEQGLALQRAAYLADPSPSHTQRLADLNSLARLLKENQAAIVDAINRDYGNRSEFETLFTEVFVVLEGIRDTAKKLKRWMKPMRRRLWLRQRQQMLMWKGQRMMAH